MKQIKSGWKSGLIPKVAGMVILIIAGSLSVHAEQSKGLTPAGKFLMDFFSAADDLSSSNAPIKLQAECSHELGQCWKSKKMNKDNSEQVQDACWQESKRCPKVCKDEYFSRRKAGMSATASDPLFRGRRDEDTSCIPGVDELTHPGRKVKINNSSIRVTVTINGQVVAIQVTATPVDNQGRKQKQTISSPIYSKGNINDNTPTPILLNLPAGRYQLQVLSHDRFYHQERAFPEQKELITVNPGKALKKNFTFGLGRLIVKTINSNDKPVNARLNLKRLDGKGYGGYKGYLFYNKALPLDVKLLSGKYNMVVMHHYPSAGKTFTIDIKDGKLTTKIITFTSSIK